MFTSVSMFSKAANQSDIITGYRYLSYIFFAPYQICALLIHLLTGLAQLLQPPDCSQYQSAHLKDQASNIHKCSLFSIQMINFSSSHKQKSKCTHEQLAVLSTIQFYMTNFTTHTPLSQVVSSKVYSNCHFVPILWN
jgi:hypothetical protein